MNAKDKAWLEQEKEYDRINEPWGLNSPWHERAYAIIDAQSAEVERLRERLTITDEKVEAATKAMIETGDLAGTWREFYARAARAALLAAGLTTAQDEKVKA